MLIYTFPTENYHPEDLPDPDLDDIEILGPPVQLTKDQGDTASLKVVVNGPQLTNISARITLTRKQNITGGSPSGGGWALSTLPTSAPTIEATWTCTNPATTVAQGNEAVFTAPFVPTATGDYRFTYRVMAEELETPVETHLDVTVSN